MDGTTLIIGIVVGSILGGAAVAVFFLLKARAAANAAAVAEYTQAEVVTTRACVDELRAQLSRAQQSGAGLASSLESAQKQLLDCREDVNKERARADQELAQHAESKRAIGQSHSRLEEREKSIAELRDTIEKSRTLLADTFKATGAELLKVQADSLQQQAKTQFEGQRDLANQELDARKQAIDATLVPLKEQLAKTEILVTALGQKAEGDAKTLGERLSQIADLQQKASSAANMLSGALRDNRQRGKWGEVSLRNIAELAGLGANVDFLEQSSFDGEEGERLRPDMIVKLPGKRCVPIDAKVPMNAYLDSLDPQLSDAERLARRVAHAQALRGHVRALASRDYARSLGGGVEITILFVPLESGLISALEEDASIYTEALDRGVVITTASTLLALLRTCALQWQQATLNENAKKIGASATDLLDRLRTFAEHLEKVGKGLESALKGYNSAVGSFNSRLLPGARATAELAGDNERLPAELELSSTAVREVGPRALPLGE